MNSRSSLPASHIRHEVGSGHGGSRPSAGAPAPGVCPETDRMLHLVDAHRALTAERSLSDVLQRILSSTCAGVGAHAGVISVTRPDGVLDFVVHHGLHGAAVADLESSIAPDGGLAGFAETRADERTRAVRMPVEANDLICGELVVWTSADRYRPVDDHLLAAFAGTVGVAVANHRLLEDAHRSRDWLNASGEITRALLAGADVDTLLDVVSRALHVAEADLAAIILPDQSNVLRAVVTVGRYADEYLGYPYGAGTPTTLEAITNKRSILLNDLRHLPSGAHPHLSEFGATMIVPLADARGARGALILLRLLGRPGFTNQDLDLATTFADQVALALEIDEARNDAEFGREIEIRHRIAEQLHDNVMQRLFATGVGLQGIAAADIPPAVAERLTQHVQALDDTIDEIRETVFGLREDGEGTRTPGRFPRVADDADDADETDAAMPGPGA